MCRIGTWNVRGIKGKERELEEEFNKANLSILGVTETKMKGKGEKILDKGSILIYSGVTMEQRARGGVGCILEQSYQKYLRKWTAISEHILRVELDLDGHNKTTLIIIYGPGEDDKTQKKEEFWERLMEETEGVTGKLLLMGDFNARVGRRDGETGGTIGRYGEDTRNSNGKRLIDFCLINNLVITNTFFQHKDIHKYTREVISRREKSIIDYVIVNRGSLNAIVDTRVKRGAEIYTDHFLVMSKIRTKTLKMKANTTDKKSNKKTTTIRSYKLRESTIAKQYTEITEREWDSGKVNLDNDLEKQWAYIKNTLLEAAEKTCGTTINDKTRKKTSWWSDEIVTEVKTKKKLWLGYLRNRSNENYSSYKTQRLKVKEMVNKAKQRSWEQFGEKMERDKYGNQKLFYKVLKNLRKDRHHKYPSIINKEGTTLTDMKEILARWREYFEDMLNTSQMQETEDPEYKAENEEHSEQEDFTVEEVKRATEMLKRGKAAGHDRITPEMLLNLGNSGFVILTRLFNTAAREGRIPADWEIGIILPIHKKGNNRDCNNYRGITLLSVVAKIYERLLEGRLKRIIEPEIDESQCGFRRGRSVQDHIFAIKQMMEKKCTDNIYLAFIDLEKAFDSIPRRLVWRSLEKRKVDSFLRRSITSLYRHTRNYIRTNNADSEEFTTGEGLRQGSVLSPTLFNLILDDVTKEVENEVGKVLVGYRNMEPVYLAQCAFADDLMICAKSEKELQRNLEVWNAALKQRNLKINLEKTKIMVVGDKDTQTTVTLEGTAIKQTNSFKYLGVTIQKDGKNDAEINNRVENASKLYYAINTALIWKKEISRKTKLTVYKTIAKPVLTYGCESWTLTNQQKNRIQAVEMKYLRGIKGVTKRDRIRSEVIRRELEVESVMNSIEKRQLSWFGHLVRMGNTRQTKKIWNAKSMRKKRRGRPRKKWDDVIADNLKKRNKTWTEGRAMAQNRKQWTDFVYSG